MATLSTAYDNATDYHRQQLRLDALHIVARRDRWSVKTPLEAVNCIRQPSKCRHVAVSGSRIGDAQLAPVEHAPLPVTNASYLGVQGL
jgi:hypothetical protein